MAWIELDDCIWEHHKTVRLCGLLNISEVQAVGHLASLWHFVLRNAWKTADLSPWGDAGIERAARWKGNPGILVAALRDCGFMTGSEVHGWVERAGKLVQDRLYNEKRRKDAVERRKSDATLPYPTLPNPTLPKNTLCPHEAIVALYHEILSGLPKVKEWTKPRQAFLAARWNESKDRQHLMWWRDFFTKVSNSDFLCGRKTDFKANLEWLVRPTNFVKVMEGQYNTRKDAGGNGAAAQAGKYDSLGVKA